MRMSERAGWRIYLLLAALLVAWLLFQEAQAAIERDTFLPFVARAPAPTATPVPTATSVPTPTATPMPGGELPPRHLDPRLPALGVSIEEANVQPGQSYWRVVEVLWLDEQQAQGGHALRWDVLAEDGSRIIGQPATVAWSSGYATVLTEPKPADEYSANFPMYRAGCSYSLAVEGQPSDRIRCLGLGTIEQRDWTIHVEYWVKFQRVVR